MAKDKDGLEIKAEPNVNNDVVLSAGKKVVSVLTTSEARWLASSLLEAAGKAYDRENGR